MPRLLMSEPVWPVIQKELQWRTRISCILQRFGFGPYKILPIFFIVIKGVVGEIYILRNIVGNKGGLGGGYCTIMCNNAPFSVLRTIFFFKHTSTHPKSNPKKQKKHLPKHLKNTSKLGGGCNNW